MKALQKLLVTIVFLTMMGLHAAMAQEQETSMPAETSQAGAETSQETVRQRVDKTIDDIKSYSAEHRDEAVKKAKAALDDFDARMKKLGTRIKDKKTLRELKEERRTAERRYRQLKHSSKKAWDNTKDAFIRDYRKLESKFEKTDTGDGK